MGVFAPFGKVIPPRPIGRICSLRFNSSFFLVQAIAVRPGRDIGCLASDFALVFALGPRCVAIPLRTMWVLRQCTCDVFPEDVADFC